MDKSVYEELFISFLAYPTAIQYHIAYFVGIESRHLLTTIYRGKHFLVKRRIQLVTERASHMVHPWGKLRSPHLS